MRSCDIAATREERIMKKHQKQFRNPTTKPMKLKDEKRRTSNSGFLAMNFNNLKK